MPIYGMLLVVLMLVRPQGLFGTEEIWDVLPRWLPRREARRGTAMSARSLLRGGAASSIQFGGLKALSDFNLGDPRRET